MHRLSLVAAAVLLALAVAGVRGDVYLHTPRGGNNRLNEANRDRTNGNRLFDSQNNNRGGSNAGSWGRPYYYSGSLVNVEWAAQHSCGPGSNNRCELVIQYMCDLHVRDGNGSTTATIPARADNAGCEQQNCDVDPRYGRHESQDWYNLCRWRKRNAGLFTSNRNLQGQSAQYTRQNENGQRFGYECPEERDYYPYWSPTPWRDVAVMTNDVGRCAAYQAESQNVKTRWTCEVPQATLDEARANPNRAAFIPIDKPTCESAAVGGVWTEWPAWNLPAPACVDNWPTRDNHNGYTLGGVFAFFNWTVPADYNENCVLRVRYNITSAEFPFGGFASASSVQAGTDYTANGQNGANRPAELDVWTKYGLTRGDVQQSFVTNQNGQRPSRGYVLDNNPTVDIFGALGNLTDATGQPLIRLQLSINTNQFSRTFSDRSYTFAIRRRPASLEPFTVHNVGVRGKRGNIVQTYPGTEYDFAPHDLRVATGDMVHFQWTGSNTSPNGAGQGPNNYDRSNIVLTRSVRYEERVSPANWRYLNATGKVKGLYGASYPARIDEVIGQPFLGYSSEAIKQLAVKGLKQPYFDLGPQQVTRDGVYHFLSTRNHAFSNRDQKGRITVTDPANPEQLALMLQLGKRWVGAITGEQRNYLPNAWLEIEYVDDQTDTTTDTLWLESVPSPFGQPYVVVRPFNFQVAPDRKVYLVIRHDQSLLRDGTIYGRDENLWNRTSLSDTDALSTYGQSRAPITTGGYYVVEGGLLWGYIALILIGGLLLIAGALRYYYVKRIAAHPKKWAGFKRFVDRAQVVLCCQKKGGNKVVPMNGDKLATGAAGATGEKGAAAAAGMVVGATGGTLVAAGAAGKPGDEQKQAKGTVAVGEKARLTVTIRKPSARTRAVLGNGGTGAMSGAAAARREATTDEKLGLLDDDYDDDAAADDADAGSKPPVVLGRMPSALLSKPGVSPPTRFGMWASNMGLYTAATSVLLGCCSIAWAASGVNNNAYMYVLTAIYCWIVAGGVAYWELMSGGTRTASRVPVRAIVYGLICIFPFFTNPTIGAGLGYLCAALVNAVAAFQGEHYVERPPARKVEAKAIKASGAADGEDDGDDDEQAVTYRCYRWCQMQREQNRVATAVFVTLYALANVAVFTAALVEWVPKGKTLGLSGYGPLAKGFGNLLDFNCAIIVVPVTRTLLKWLYNYSTADQSCSARLLRGVLAFVPLDLNLAWHKLIAQMILFSTAGHMVMHFFNYAYAPHITSAVFGLWPWVSGAIVCVCMLCIYAAARDDVKEGQFEIFWYSHHAFVGFFFFLLLHGSPAHGYFNPNFWKWFLLPGTLYVAERVLRWYKALQPASVLSVIYMTSTKPDAAAGAGGAGGAKRAADSSDVLALEFDKVGVFASPYKEGQYLFLNCPAISRFEWHPFTISSAPQEASVTVHIRLAGDGSWTRRVYEYLAAMGPAGASYFPLYRHGLKDQVRGKIEGPDGQQLFQIDGPHSAPTQHIGEYETVMVVGGGIGVTPVSSTLKSVVYHRWRSAIGRTFPNNAYFYWVIAWKDVDCFRWLVRIIKDVEDELAHLRATSPHDLAKKRIEFHIWVTSAPDPQPHVQLDVDDECALWGVPERSVSADAVDANKTRAPFTAMDLYSAMRVPDRYVRLGDVHIRKGRPAWPDAFKSVATQHPTGDVGVLFCGNPAIANDLESACFESSRGRKGGRFSLHKENF